PQHLQFVAAHNHRGWHLHKWFEEPKLRIQENLEVGYLMQQVNEIHIRQGITFLIGLLHTSPESEEQLHDSHQSPLNNHLENNPVNRKVAFLVVFHQRI